MILWIGNFDKTQLGHSSAPCGINWGLGVVFNWRVGRYEGFKWFFPHASATLVGMIQWTDRAWAIGWGTDNKEFSRCLLWQPRAPSVSRPPCQNCIAFCDLTLKSQNIIPATFSSSNKGLQPAQSQREGHWTQTFSEGIPKLLDHLESAILEVGEPVKGFVGGGGIMWILSTLYGKIPKKINIIHNPTTQKLTKHCEEFSVSIFDVPFLQTLHMFLYFSTERC